MDDRPAWELELERAGQGDVDEDGEVERGRELVTVANWRQQLAVITAAVNARREMRAPDGQELEYTAWLVAKHQEWLDRPRALTT